MLHNYSILNYILQLYNKFSKHFTLYLLTLSLNLNYNALINKIHSNYNKITF